MTTTPAISANAQPLFSVEFQAISEAQDGNGVLGATDLEVTAGSGALESDVATGSAVYNGTSGTLGSTATKTHSSGDSNDDRWDLLAFDVSTGSVVLREGTAAASPSPPSLQSDEVLLAVVFVEAQASDFTGSEIVNWRFLAAPADHDHTEGRTSTVPNAGLTNDSVTVAGQTVALGGSTAVSIDNLSDVALPSTPVAGQPLLYHATNSQFEPGAFVAGTGLSSSASDASVTLDTNLGNGVETDGSDNIRVNGGAVAGNVLSENGTNAYQVDLNIGNGVEDNTGTLRVNPTEIAGDGLKETSATSMGVEPADFAGDGLADDGSDNLTPDTSDEGTVTATGGSQPAVDTTVTTSLSQTDAFDVILYVDADPSFNADYAFNWDYSHSWDDTNSNVDIDLTVSWDTDPGSSNDVTLRWEVIRR